MTKLSSTFEIVIRPKQPWLHFDWRGLVQYRDLFWEMVRRDFSARYKQTILGPLWFVINPLITTFIMVVVFSKGLGVQTDDIPGPLFFLGGLLGWNYFAGILGATANSLGGNAHLFGKVYFPRLIVPLSVVASNLISFLLQLALLAAVYVFFGITRPLTTPRPTEWLWLMPLLVLQTGMLALGVGLILSAVSAKYKDFGHLTGFFVQIWMYLTPIIYPLSKIHEKWPEWEWAFVINPMTCITEGMRAMLFGTHPVQVAITTGQHVVSVVLTPTQYAISVAITVVLLMTGVLVFQRTARTFIDYV